MARTKKVLFLKRKKDIFKLTIIYIDEDGNTVQPTVIQYLKYNAPYNVTSTLYEGMTADIERIEGNITDDITYTVTYYYDICSFVIYYRYSNGSTAYPTITLTGRFGESYSQNSPHIEGYTTNRPNVSGTFASGTRSTTVTYIPQSTIGDDPDAPVF